MLWTKTFIPTLKEIPQEAETVSHQLLLRAGLVRMLMFLELMLNAANIALVALGPETVSQAYAVMLFAIAAAEAGIGLALIITLASVFRTLEAENIRELKG